MSESGRGRGREKERDLFTWQYLRVGGRSVRGRKREGGKEKIRKKNSCRKYLKYCPLEWITKKKGLKILM